MDLALGEGVVGEKEVEVVEGLRRDLDGGVGGAGRGDSKCPRSVMVVRSRGKQAMGGERETSGEGRRDGEEIDWA